MLITVCAGDIVGLFAAGKALTDKTLSGVVTQSKETSISVAFDELPDTVDLASHNGSIQLVKLANDVTYRRIKRCVWYTCTCTMYNVRVHVHLETAIIFQRKDIQVQVYVWV